MSVIGRVGGRLEVTGRVVGSFGGYDGVCKIRLLARVEVESVNVPSLRDIDEAVVAES